MKPICFFVVLLPLLAGCRRESWQETAFPAPPGLSSAEIVSALTQLDSQTPPEVTVSDGTVRVRYNSLRIAPRNFSYHLEALAARKEAP